MKMKKCLDAAIGLSEVDNERFLSLREKYKQTGAANPDIRAAKDLEAEIIEERATFLDKIKSVAGAVSAKLKDYMTMDLFSDPEPIPEPETARTAAKPKEAQLDLFAAVGGGAGAATKGQVQVTVDTPAYKKLRADAAKALPTFDKMIIDLANEFGAKAKTAPLKGDKRSLEKINVDYKGDVSGLKDAVRATLIAPTPEIATEIYNRLMAMPGAIKNKGFRNWFVGDTPDPFGYRDAKLNFVTNGVPTEIQISTPEMIEAKAGEGHKIYEQARVIYASIGSEDREATAEENRLLEELMMRSREVYGNAFSSISNAAGNRSFQTSRDNNSAPPNRLGTENGLGEDSSNATATPLPTDSTTGTPSTDQKARPRTDFIDTSDNQSISLRGQNVQKKRGVSSEIQPDLLAEPSGESTGDLRPAGEGRDVGSPAGSSGRSGGGRSDRGAGGVRSERRDSSNGGDDGAGSRDSNGVSGRSARRREYVAPRNEGLNFSITDADQIGVGGLRKKYSDNLAAIKLLKEIEQAGRKATPEEQTILAKYVGWGGLKNAFFNGDPETLQGYQNKFGSDSSQLAYYERGQAMDWSRERRELLTLLTLKEYSDARGSTPNAHYTAPQVISAMWDAVKHLGFEQGRILEPAMGVGHFFGLMPKEMRSDSTMTGVELDSLSGRISQQLYQSADIRVEGFEKAQLPDGFYDLAISNVPFGDYKVADPKHDKHQANIHDYFFLKSLDRVREGGVVAFITSSGTMDKLSPKIRDVLGKRADLLGAIRLPNNAFKENAATEVTTDIIFLKKRGAGEKQAGQTWSEVRPTKDNALIKINEYFIRHPEMMMGEMGLEGSMYGSGQQALVLRDSAALPDMLAKAIKNLPKQAYKSPASDVKSPEPHTVVSDGAKEGSTIVEGGKVYQIRGSLKARAAELDKYAAVIADAGKVRDAIRKHFALQISDTATDAQFNDSLVRINKVYDDFVKDHGRFNTKQNAVALSGDVDVILLQSLERVDKKAGTITKADIFTVRTVSRRGEVKEVDSAVDAMNVSMNELGKLNFAHMSKISGMTEAQLVGELGERIFFDPEAQSYQTAESYLSGDVRQKLRVAETAALTEPRYKPNIEALKKAIPEDIPLERVSVSLGQAWVPLPYLEEFISDTFGSGREGYTVSHSQKTGDWTITPSRYGSMIGAAAANKYGASGFGPIALMEQALNLKKPTVYLENVDGTRTVNQKATFAAREKQDAIKAAFSKWVGSDPVRATDLQKIYNERFNSTVLQTYNGAHLTLPGTNPLISLRGNVKDGAWRIISSGKNVLLAHAVGAGKTYTMISGGMELKRLGLVKKPMYVVPNHMLMQFSNEFLGLYPNAKVLIASKEDLAADKRKAFAAKTATGDWDAVVITHSSFQKIEMSPEAVARHIQNELSDFEDAVVEASQKKEDSRLMKRLQKQKRNLQAKLEKALDASKKDDLLTFEELGVDQLFVDEAHYFKNLAFVTKMDRVAGLTTVDSQRSQDMFLKTQYVTNLHNGKRGVVFATGTPISNSVTELFTMQRYLDMSGLKSLGLEHFDHWASMFGEVVTKVEANPTGEGYRTHSRFAKFKNMPELMKMFGRTADIKTSAMLALPVPDVKGGSPQVTAVPASDDQKSYVSELVLRAEAIKNRQVQPHEDNMLKVTSDGRKAALDMRLIDPSYPDHPGSKVNALVSNVFRIWQSSTPTKGAQLIFSDLSTPKTDGSFSIYNDIRQKLIAKGIPAEEVQFIHSFDTDVKKDALFDKVRNGEVRVLLGSTDKMGAGTNVQRNLIGKHDLDAPWRPSDIEQRDGRIIRQGNQNKVVEVERYVTTGTFDVYSWQTLETKARFIDQVMSGDTSIREIEDNDGRALSFAEVKALAMGNPLVIEKVGIESDIAKLSMSRESHMNSARSLARSIDALKKNIEKVGAWIESAEKDVSKVVDTRGDKFAVTIDGKVYTDRLEAGQALDASIPKMGAGSSKPIIKTIGKIGGFDIQAYVTVGKTWVNVVGAQTYDIELGETGSNTLARIGSFVRGLEDDIASQKSILQRDQAELKKTDGIANQPFEKQGELDQKLARLAEIDNELGINDDDGVEDSDGANSVEQKRATYNTGAVAKLRSALEAQFVAQTGLSTDVAELMLAGVEMRNLQRKGGKPAGQVPTLTMEKSPFTAQQLAMLQLHKNAGAKKVQHAYHTTPAANLESIRLGGIAPGKTPRHAGVSSALRVSLGLSESAAKAHGAKGDVMLRTKAGYVLPGNVEHDLLASGGGDSALTTDQTIPPDALEVRQGRAWVPLIQPIEKQRPTTTPDRVMVEGVPYSAMNSEGKPIHPTEEGIRNFVRWFGDSRATHNGKTMAQGGKPKVVYHGTNAKFTAFDMSKALDEAHFFTDDAKHAGTFGKAKGFYVRMTNPMEISQDELDAEWDREHPSGEQDKRGLLPRDFVRKFVKDAKSAKHDSLIIREMGDRDVQADMFLPFNAAQIKSSEENVGEFSLGTDSVVNQKLGSYNVTPEQVTQGIKDIFATKKTFNAWWHKSVGTQYHKAEASPLFKKVFDEAQAFISDVSSLANAAADRAVNLLPQLNSFSDLKRKPLSKQDNEALQAAVFSGTLMYTRDEMGNLVSQDSVQKKADELDIFQKGKELFRRGVISEQVLKMWQGMQLDRFTTLVNNSYNKNVIGGGGVVFTDAELRREFGLNDRQINLYREFRAATDKSVTQLAITEMLSYAKDMPEAQRREILEMDSIADASELMRDYFFDLAEQYPDSTEGYDKTGNQMIDIGDKAQSLIDRGYAPLMRFGKYTVYVTRGNEQVYFGMFEREADATAMARRMQAQEKGAVVQQGVLSEEAFKIMAGMTPDTLELFADLTDTGRTEAFADFIRMAKNNRSAMKRLLQRKGTAGFSTDVTRVLASFLTSNARASSGNLHHSAIRQAVSDIPKESGDVKDEAVKLMEYVQNPVDEAASIRGLLFVQYIGGSIASALVNLTQPMTMTIPYLSQFVGPARAGGVMAAAMKDALSKKLSDPVLAAAIAQGEKEGIVSPQEIHQLQGEASRNLGNNIYLRRGLFLWGSLFSLAEQYNRRNTFIAAFRVAQEQKMEDPYAFASRAVTETQGLYNKANKPNWARGAVGGTIFTFKQFSIHYMEFLKRLPNRERALALAILVAASGLQGLPFSDDLDDLLDTIGQALGYSWNTKQQKQEFAAAVLGRDGAEFLMRGFSAMPGVPVDVAGRMGMSNLLPGTGLLLKSKDNKQDEVLEVLGPAGGVVRDALKGEFLPIAIRNMAKGVDWYNKGFAVDGKGRKVDDITAIEAAGKVIGFNPASVARGSRAIGLAMQNIALARNTESSIANLWAEGRSEGSLDKVKRAQQQLADWNAKNPEARIRITSEQIARRVKELRTGRDERMIKRAPRELRQQTAELLE